MNDTKPALPEPTRPNESGSTPVLARWMLETSAGWLAAHDKEAFATYADQCTAAAQARIAELNALLTDARDMLTILAKRYTLTILDNDSVREVLSDLNAALASTSGAEPADAHMLTGTGSVEIPTGVLSPPVVQPEAANKPVDLMALYKQACDLADWANAQGTIMGNERALYEASAKLRDMLGAATHVASPPSAELKTLSDEEIDATCKTEPAAIFALMGEAPGTVEQFRSALRSICRAIEHALAAKNGAPNA